MRLLAALIVLLMPVTSAWADSGPGGTETADLQNYYVETAPFYGWPPGREFRPDELWRENQEVKAFQKICQEGKAAEVRAALAAGADPQGVTCFSSEILLCGTALTAAVQSDIEYIEKIGILVQAGADPNALYGRVPDFMTPLSWAVTKGRVDAARLLIEAGAEARGLVYCGEDFCRDLLITACESPGAFSALDQAAMIRLLLEAGADARAVYTHPHAKRNKRDTALHRAANGSGPEVLGMLLEAGLQDKINQRDTVGWTPLMRAAIDNKNPESIRLLLHRGADPLIRDQRLGRTAYQYAVKLKRAEEIQIILKEAESAGKK